MVAAPGHRPPCHSLFLGCPVGQRRFRASLPCHSHAVPCRSAMQFVGSVTRMGRKVPSPCLLVVRRSRAYCRKCSAVRWHARRHVRPVINQKPAYLIGPLHVEALVLRWESEGSAQVGRRGSWIAHGPVVVCSEGEGVVGGVCKSIRCHAPAKKRRGCAWVVREVLPFLRVPRIFIARPADPPTPCQ